MDRPRILVTEEDLLRDWGPLRSMAEVSVLRRPDDGGGDGGPGVAGGADVEGALAAIRDQAGRADRVLAERTEGFLWHCLFRMAGDTTPFLLVPRFNHVQAPSAYALLLSSQLALPRDLLFAGSEAARRSFARFGFRASPRFMPGIDLDRFGPLPENRGETRSALGVDRDRPLLLFAGRLEEDKHVLELLETVERVRVHRDVELVVCFHFFREEYREKCVAKAEAMGDVRLVEDPEADTLTRWYNAADLFVSTAVSLFETFGRAPVEAMACGTPPVVSAYDGFRETVGEECGFLVPTTVRGPRKWPDVEAFAETVLEALADRGTRERKARAGLERAERYGRERTVRSMLEELDGGARGGNGGGASSDERLRLDPYPEDVARLWEPLDGRPVGELVREFLADGEIPVRPPDSAVRDFYLSWFSHY